MYDVARITTKDLISIWLKKFYMNVWIWFIGVQNINCEIRIWNKIRAQNTKVAKFPSPPSASFVRDAGYLRSELRNTSVCCVLWDVCKTFISIFLTRCQICVFIKCLHSLVCDVCLSVLASNQNGRSHTTMHNWYGAKIHRHKLLSSCSRLITVTS